MSDMVRAYGRGLVAVFVAAVAAWALLLIAVPQLTMLDKSLRAPGRALDSSVAATVARDARTCQSVLKEYLPEERDVPSAGGNGGLAIPSASGMSVPSAGGMAVPSAGSAAPGKRPYILQCDRATTDTKLVRDADAPPETLITLYGMPELRVDEATEIQEQIDQAEKVAATVDPLYRRLLEDEKNALPWSGVNFATLVAARPIPMSPETKAAEDAKFANQVFDVIGLRYEEDGVTYVRLSLVTLVRTLFFAVIATALALLICYPIAYNLALNSGPRKAMWLFLALVIPYAIVELMRVYAWVSLIETRGLINYMLDWIGLIDIDKDEAIPFKRSPITVFVVIVYTYILFMVFPMVNVMSTLDKNQLEAGRDLGASTWRLHWRIIIPHAKPGIAVGCITTFMLSAGAFSVPRIISRGLQSEWFSQTIYNKFFESENSNVGAAYSFAFTILCFVIVALFMWIMRARLKDFVRA